MRWWGVILAAALAAGAAEPELVACWHFDEPGGEWAIDATGHGFDARMVGGTRIAGVAGGAVRLNGQGQALVADGVGALAEGGIEAWVRLDKPQAPGQVGFVSFARDLGGKSDLALFGFCAAVNKSTGLAMAFYADAWRGAAGTEVPPVGQWVHLAAAWGATGVAIYLNGREVARDETYRGGLPLHPQVLLGAGSWNSYLACALDEVRLYRSRPEPGLFAAHAADRAYAALPVPPKAPAGMGPQPVIDAAAHYDSASPTSGLQAAIDAVPRTGGVVVIPPGRYLLQRGLVLRSNVTLRGAGPSTVLCRGPEVMAKATADIPAGATSFAVEDATGLELGAEVAVMDRKLYGWNTTHAVLTAIDGGRLTIDRPTRTAYQAADGAMVVNQFAGLAATGAQDFQIADLTIAGDPPRQTATTIVDFTMNGIHLTDCRRAQVRGVRVTGWPADGIGVQIGSEIQVSGCLVSRNRGHGFHPGTGLRNALFVGNTARENGWDGLYFCMNVKHTTVTGNVFVRNGWNGIGGLGNGGDEWNTCTANTCAENAMAGILMNDGKNNTVSGNVCVDNSTAKAGRYAGITVLNCTGCLITGNRCADSREQPTQLVGCSERGQSDRNLFSGNHCDGSQKAIETVGAATRAEGNLGP